MNRRVKNGFTLTELLVSIAIIGVLTMLITENFRHGGLVEDLRYSSQTLSGNIRKMQTIATSGQTTTVNGTEEVPAGGYGIFFDYELIPCGVPPCPGPDPVTSYLTFADLSKKILSRCYPLLSTETNGIYEEDCDPLTYEYFFRPLVRISSFQRDDEELIELDNIPGASMNIVFKPPKPTPIITYSTAPGAATYRVGRLRIELFHERANAYRTITVNSVSGQISERAGRIGDSEDAL